MSEDHVFIIPSPNIPKFQERFDKLVRRAQRIGCEIPSYNVVKEEPKVLRVKVGTEEVFLSNGDMIEREVFEDRVILMHHLVISNPLVVVAGHEFVATIEHTEDGNILHTVRGKTVPPKFRDCQPWCDHCKTLRRRNDTFVVRNILQDSFLQVGRNCLADFLGKDAERIAFAAELYCEINELAEALESEGSGNWGSGKRYDLLETYLGHVAEVIAHCGWLSRSVARDREVPATADIAYTNLHPYKKTDRLYQVSEKSLETAKLAIAWCEDLSDLEVEKSDYLHNIRLIARRGVVGDRQYGFAASIVSGYQRHIGELRRKEKEQEKPSEYVGEVGERRIFTLTVDKVIQCDGNYGTSYLHLLSDPEGNKFSWFSSGVVLDTGKQVLIKGTVKDHKEYRGTKQTVLSRCQEVSELPVPKKARKPRTCAKS